MFRKIGILVVVLAVGFGAGYYVAKRGPAPPTIKTGTELRDRPIAERDTSTTTRPEVRIVYQRVPYPVSVPADTVFLPSLNFRVVGVISPTPLDISGRTVTLTYFSLADSAFVQNRYTLKRPVWGYSLSAFTEIGVFNTAAIHAFGLSAKVRYKNTSLYLNAASGASNTAYATFGIRYRFAGVD